MELGFKNKNMKIGIIGIGIVGGAVKYGMETLGHKVRYHDIKHNTKIEDILDYCEKDVITTEKLFYEQLKDIERTFVNKGPREVIQHALIHGRSMAYTAIVEHNGIPVDNKLLDEINKHFILF